MRQLVVPDRDIAENLTRNPFYFKHRLADTGLFEDAALEKLIERARTAGPQFYTLGSLDEDGFGQKWQNGILGDIAAPDVLDAVKNGRLWLQIQHLDELSPEHYALAKRGFEDLSNEARGFSWHKLTANILISSPQAKVLCHIDCPEVVLWHVRGRKRVWLYDYKGEIQVPDIAIEKIIMRESEEEINYHPEWDRHAIVRDLEPGMAANWPHLWPHRVENLGDFNVSLQTEFYSPKSLRAYGVRYANGLMRRYTPFTPRSTATQGLPALAKSGLGLLAKKTGLHRPAERKIQSRFTVDPKLPGAIRPLNAGESEILAK